MKTKTEQLTRSKVIRLTPRDLQSIEDTAAKLGLPASEVTRRSIRIALPILRDLNLPGTPKQEEHQLK